MTNQPTSTVPIPDPPDDKTLHRVGLKRHEYEELCARLGRKPNIVEMGMVGAMWSEHCAYKSSKVHLRKLPTAGRRVLQGPGENAGIVQVTEEVAVAFKIESHNHPSAVEPFQSAATGIGGIIRDIFAMGARPIASLDPLRFGPITGFYNPQVPRAVVERNRYLMNGVVSGIAHYGNCIGIPTVGGELVFDESYSANPLMNGLSLGVVRPSEIIRAMARGEGNKVVLVGAKTGPDGVQGATFASVDLAEDVTQDRPAVQVGDPFLEKCLLEATLALRKHPALIGVQDLGAAGLTSSSCEMAGRGKVGLRINLDVVPLRAATLTPYEIMLSESQERMLMVLQKEGVEDVSREFTRWELDATVIGEVISEPVVSLWVGGEEIVRLPTALLTDESPELDRSISERPQEELPYVEGNLLVEEAASRKLPVDFPVQARCRTPTERALCLLLAHPNQVSKRLVWQQYDFQVRDNTVRGPEAADAAVLRIKDSPAAIAISTDGPGHLAALDPHLGGVHAIKEAYLNLVASGAEPLAYTNCLNFANPEVPEVMWEFVSVVEGMAAASQALAVPVVSGNVSFYNETVGSRVIPTPVIGMVGVIPEVKRARRFVWGPDEIVFIISAGRWNLAGSALAWDLLHERRGLPEQVALDFLVRLKDLVLTTNRHGLLASLHDIDSAGLTLALAECALSGVGADIELPQELLEHAADIETVFFGYPPVGIVGSCPREKFGELSDEAERHSLRILKLGCTAGSELRIRAPAERTANVVVETGAIKAIHEHALSFWLKS